MAHYFNETTALSSLRDVANKPSRRQVVLVVEDHEDTRLLYRHVLELRGFEVIEAQDGHEAVRLAQEIGPDLVLIDTNLPRVDGLMATRRMREHSSLREVPIVFISGHAGPEWRATALAAGGSDYLIKPIALGELEASVYKQLNGRKRDPAATQ